MEIEKGKCKIHKNNNYFCFFKKLYTFAWIRYKFYANSRNTVLFGNEELIDKHLLLKLNNFIYY